MNPKAFQIAYGAWLKSVLEDPKGQAMINALCQCQPPYPSSDIPHLFARGSGQREGFDACIKSLVALSQSPVIQKEPEIDYGVKDTQPSN